MDRREVHKIRQIVDLEQDIILLFLDGLFNFIIIIVTKTLLSPIFKKKQAKLVLMSLNKTGI